MIIRNTKIIEPNSSRFEFDLRRSMLFEQRIYLIVCWLREENKTKIGKCVCVCVCVCV